MGDRLRRFIITESEADLTSHAGLGLIGMALNERTDLAADAEVVSPLRSNAVPHATILWSSIALLCLDKSDFEGINGFREDSYFAAALGLDQVPSEGIVRQRMDANTASYKTVVEEAAIEFLRRSRARLTPLDNGRMSLDCDVTPFDNSQPKKEGISRTYKGEDGYAPMAAYLGQEGYCLELELREGSQHCQKGTPEFLQCVLERARQLTATPLLLRLDSGNDALENIAVVETHNERDEQAAQTDYLIKWNPRRESPEKWRAYAGEQGDWSAPRAGKRVARFDVVETRTHDGYEYPLRRVMRVIERTIDKRRKQLLVPEVKSEGWWTSLVFDAETIIALYADHGASAQYHSEFKTDLDIERLPSGKFATNALILACAQLPYNILSWIGQNGLLGPDAPPRNRAKSRRIRRHAGDDVPGRAADPYGTQIEASLRLRLPGGSHLSTAVCAIGRHLIAISPESPTRTLSRVGFLLPAGRNYLSNMSSAARFVASAADS